MGWYESVEQAKSIEQGDFLPDIPVVFPTASQLSDELEVDIKEIDGIILSQTCDLENDKLELALVCPLLSLKEFFDEHPNTKSSGIKAKDSLFKKLKVGSEPAYHLLNSCDVKPLSEDMMVVSFREVFSVNTSFLKTFHGKQETVRRLKSPYKEHLSQAFARYFMRVGLPQDLMFKKELYK